MKAKDFEVGDRVIVSEFKNERYGKVYTNEKAKVIEIDDSISLEFDNFVDGNSCGEIGREGHCLWFLNSLWMKIGISQK